MRHLDGIRNALAPLAQVPQSFNGVMVIVVDDGRIVEMVPLDDEQRDVVITALRTDTAGDV